VPGCARLARLRQQAPDAGDFRLLLAQLFGDRIGTRARHRHLARQLQCPVRIIEAMLQGGLRRFRQRGFAHLLQADAGFVAIGVHRQRRRVQFARTGAVRVRQVALVQGERRRIEDLHRARFGVDAVRHRLPEREDQHDHADARDRDPLQPAAQGRRPPAHPVHESQAQPRGACHVRSHALRLRRRERRRACRAGWTAGRSRSRAGAC
jgi:hypothetical protein